MLTISLMKNCRRICIDFLLIFSHKIKLNYRDLSCKVLFYTHM